MDGFKNTTKTKYMCGGPVRKATGGAIKSVAPKSVAKSAASAKQLPTPEIAPKRQVQPTPPKNVTKPDNWFIPGKNGSSGGLSLKFMDDMQKRQVQPTPPKDVRAIGGEPKAPKATSSPQWKKSDEDAVTSYSKATSVEDGKKFRVALGKAKEAKTATPPEPIREAPRPTMEPKRQVLPTPPKGVKTLGGAPKDAKTVGSILSGAKTMFQDKGRQPNTIGGAPKTPPEPIREAPRLTMEPERQVQPTRPKGVSSVNIAKRGVPVASKKPMIGQYKTGGYVSKSSFKW